MPPKGKKPFYKKAKKGNKKKQLKTVKPVRGYAGTALTYNRVKTQYYNCAKSYLGQVIYTAGNSYNQAFRFDLLAMPDYAQLAQVFAHYMINSITLTFRFMDITSDDTFTLDNVPSCHLYIAHNYDSTLNDASHVAEKRNMVSHTFTKEKNLFSYTVYPKTVSPVYLSAVSTGYKVNPKVWVEKSYQSVSHYGALLWIPSIPVGTRVACDYTYNVSWKHSQ